MIGLIVLAALATGILVTGQQTGKFTIFGDAFITPIESSPLALATQTTSKTVVAESFNSLRFFDPATTADWNLDAGEVTLPYGLTEGMARSLEMADLSANKVWVALATDEDRPEGSEIYYAVSPDNGLTWQPLSDLRPAIFVSPAGTWRWRAYLVRGVASRPPAIHELKLTFYTKNS